MTTHPFWGPGTRNQEPMMIMALKKKKKKKILLAPNHSKKMLPLRVLDPD